MAKEKTKEKKEVRESKPLAETPEYDYDAYTLADKLKKIQSDSSSRTAANYAARKLSSDKRREAMSSKASQSGGGSKLQGLNTNLGGKIIT